MKNYQVLIINKLLDKYERSSLSRNENTRIINIQISILDIDKKYFDYDHYEQTQAINDALSIIQAKQYLTKTKQSPFKIRLNLSYLSQIYDEVKRKSLILSKNQFINILNEIEVDNHILFLKDEMITSYQNDVKVKYLDFNNIDEIIDIFNGISYLLKNEDEISIRNASIIIYNDSKKLEQLLTKILRITKDYLNIENIEQLNLVKRPSLLYLKGNLVIKINDQVIDFSDLNTDLIISSSSLKMLEIVDIKAQYLISIENLTSFYDTNLDNAIIVYLGGFHNKAKATLLNKIAQFKKLEYFHFGDMDAGGFYIYQNLINDTNLAFKMVGMDLKNLIKYEKYCKKCSSDDLKRLQTINELLNLEVIDYMIKHQIKLEQEVITLTNQDLKGEDYEENRNEF
ncbi:MAG: Wadjet anti-phage system protein JetD domain-containing protein [Bacilli bacterium]